MQVGILRTVPRGHDERVSGSKDCEKFEQLLGSFPLTFASFQVTEGEYPADSSDLDAYLITGSPRGVYDSEPWISDLMEFIRAAFERKQKLVGVCFGHQVLAHALGGKAEKSPRGWGLGKRVIQVHERRSWMRPEQQSLSLHFSHQDQVVKLPPGAKSLGGDEFCPYALFSIEGRALGIQGHPEFSKSHMLQLIECVKDRAGEPTYLAAAESLEAGPLHSEIVASWIHEFLLSS